MRYLRMLLRAVLASPLLLTLLLPNEAWGQTQPATFTVAATAQCGAIRASNNSTVGIIVSGTWSGTLTPNMQISTASGAPTVAKKVVPVDSTTPQATITANGGYRADVAGFTQFNLCSTGTWTSGTATVTLYAVPPPAASTVASGSGGSGTVTSVAATVNGGASSGALAITGSPITASGTLNFAFTGTNGDVMTFGASNAPTDSLTLLSSLAPLASPTFTGTPAAPTPVSNINTTQIPTTAWVNTYFAPLASPTFTGATLMSNSLTLQNPGTSQTLQLSNGNCSGALCATANEYVNLSYDATNTAFFLQSYKSGTGSTRSLCFGASSSEQWCTDSSGEFKPFVDNTRTLGTTTLRPSTTFTYILDMKGLLTNYNNVATAGYGQAVIRGSVVATAQVAAISTTTAYAVPSTSNALFRISGNIGCSASSSGGTATVTLSWTDTSSTVQTAVPTLATCTTLGSASMTSFTQLVQAKLSTNITYAVAIANTPTYDLRFTVEQLTSN
jgi:hypothetical protein